MKVCEYIVKKLKNDGISHVFGYQGGNITNVVDALYREPGIEYVQSYNEQGAAFAANTYSMVSGIYGVAISSSGPGAINMINGIANAYYDSLPVLFITGNINTATMRANDSIRQNGFQEADIVGMVKGITKYAKTIMNAADIEKELALAMNAMLSGRKGPVLLDIPHNIQREEIGDIQICDNDIVNDYSSNNNLDSVLDILKQSERPIILVGNGCRNNNSSEKILQLSSLLNIPVVSSLCGIDVCSGENYYGMIGSFGLDNVNNIFSQSDCVLALGSRMDERQKYAGTGNLFEGKKIIHVEIDESEMKHSIADELVINMDCSSFLDELLSHDKELAELDFSEWNKQARDIYAAGADNYTLGKKCAKMLANVFSYENNSAYVIDVGCHQMATAQVAKLKQKDYYLNSAGLGSMGFSIPGAIGAFYADPSKRIIAICGDGGFMMNLQELQWINREKLPISIVVVNNRSLEMIANYQRLAFEGRTIGSVQGYEAPDFKRIAEAFGFKYLKADETTIIGEGNEPRIIELEV